MKQFFLRLHFLITNPAAFVLSYTSETRKTVFRFFMSVLTVMFISTVAVRTVKVTRELPATVGEIFQGVTIANDTLKTDSVIVVKQWEFAELVTLMNGRLTLPELYPESLLIVAPEGSSGALMELNRDSLVVTFALSGDTLEKPFRFGESWSRLIPENDTLQMNATGVSEFIQKRSFSLFFTLFVTQLNLLFQDLLSYFIMLWILVLIYRRELSSVWVKGSTFRILVNGTMPYLLLMPVFAVAGNRGDLLTSVSIVVAAIIISRAFRHHRLTLLLMQKNAEKDQ